MLKDLFPASSTPPPQPIYFLMRKSEGQALMVGVQVICEDVKISKISSSGSIPNYQNTRDERKP